MPTSPVDGLLRACRYSYATNRLNYCGPENAFQAFQSFVADPTPAKAPQIRKLLEGFAGLNLYLDLIASANGLDRFDEAVIEAYWVGNRLLDNIPFEAFKAALSDRLPKAGLPKAIAESKVAGLAPSFNAHHSFHVLYINFITPKVPKIVENLDACLPLAGKIVEVRGDQLTLAAKRLVRDAHGFSFEPTLKTVENPFIERPQAGVLVSFHWSTAVERLSQAQATALQRYTLVNLEAVNSLGLR